MRASRLAVEDLDKIILKSGAHNQRAKNALCVMEAVAWVAGEKHSDHPVCASRVIGAFLRSWNDAMSEADRQQLKPLIPRLINTAASEEIELKRSYMALDWYCRVSAPAWLRLAGLVIEAEAIEATAPIVDTESARAAREALDKACVAASAAWAAAGDAAGAAARDAAGDAAWDAAWAKLLPTVEALQKSAIDLVERMIALSDPAESSAQTQE